MGRQQTKCHGSEERFEVVAQFIYDRFGRDITYIADVAGGQGMLSKLLTKRYNYRSEVIDPRGYVLKGVENRECEYTPDMAGYYDLVVGLHPDQATRPVVESAFTTPVLVVPCCNYWDRSRKLGTKALVEDICRYLTEHKIPYELITFDFKGPKNVGILTHKP
ncbi:hypothetical protein [uncultured Neglectibacter sp.]|uniref:hypothetical protein n=1 Tax=uncultured Neglectibacter sp. TaxID=1924108 RepID=UPI0034DFAF2A